MWIQYLIVVLIAALALWITIRGRRCHSQKSGCESCPLGDNCKKRH